MAAAPPDVWFDGADGAAAGAPAACPSCVTVCWAMAAGVFVTSRGFVQRPSLTQVSSRPTMRMRNTGDQDAHVSRRSAQTPRNTPRSHMYTTRHSAYAATTKMPGSPINAVPPTSVPPQKRFPSIVPSPRRPCRTGLRAPPQKGRGPQPVPPRRQPPGAHTETRDWRRAVAAHLRAFRFCIWINWRSLLGSVNARKRKIKMCRTVSKTPSRNARGHSPLVISRCHRESNNAPYPQHTLLSMKSCRQHSPCRQALSTVFFDFSMTQFIYPTSRVQESGFGF